MDTTPFREQLKAAQGVLGVYYGELVKRMAEEIVDRHEDFETPMPGGADNILTKYHHQLAELEIVYQHLLRYEKQCGPDASQPLGRGEFRCFSCGASVRWRDERCKRCGWRWLKDEC
jgi:predicted RNA-binding Zn-ribbon protein involved in translation (DUF1610 family)